MIHNDVEYWRHLESLPPGHPDLPTPRVCRLLRRTFERWRDKPLWLTEQQTGHLFRDLPESEASRFAAMSVQVRKAHAVARMLEVITRDDVTASGGTLSIDADELIVGTLPPFSVGQGKEFVRYLTKDEELRGALDFLNELSPMGHIVPDHGLVLSHGLEGIAAKAQRRAADAEGDRAAFYESVQVALAGVKGYAEAHAAKVEALLASLAEGDPRRSSLATVAENLRHSPAQPARTFHQALQAIYLVHCALHWTVEVVPLGRLDQLLQPLLQADLDAKRLTLDEAQELVDCLWIKLDERVILDRRHAENRFTSCDGVLTGYLGASNFDQGGLINQWMQQVTIGGTLPDDDDQPNDACNDVTRLCLHAARRLPLNSPTLDLRVHAGTPEDVLALAARALLSGGAHPVLLNDDVIVPALAEHSGGEVPLRTARNYACDGCYETMFAGETEFSFGFVPALDALEKTLNRGAGIQAAGAVHLRGWKDSWRSKRAGEIADFEELWSILRDHVSLGCHRYVRSVLALYGNKAGVAPSPLLSALIRGCVERGRDLVDGGANYRIFSPLMVGVSNAADSLFVIEELVFKQRRFDLEELLTCLVTDWGDRLIVTDGEPRVAFGRHVPVHRIAEIRALCLEQPKFGSGDPRVDALAWRLLETFAECVREAVEHPVHREARARLEAKYGTEEHPFRLLFAPGVGTFEQYVFSGSFAGASPDGRRAGAPIASDLSPAPIPSDQPPTEVVAGVTRHRRTHRLADGLRSYAHEGAVLLGDGAPADFNLPEDTSPEALTEALRTFARGEGGSVCTFTVCDPSTFEEARRRPEDFNLLRVRMGGWTEFFVTLFPEHQEQHRRRPLYHA